MNAKIKCLTVFAVVLLSACGENNWNGCQCELNGNWSGEEVYGDDFTGPITSDVTLQVQDGVGYFQRKITDQNGTGSFNDGTIEFLSCDSSVTTQIEYYVLEGQISQQTREFEDYPLIWQFHDDCNAIILNADWNSYADTLDRE